MAHLAAFGLLKNGIGGVDWAGLPFVVAHLGIDDVPGLIDAIKTIKNHEPNRDDE